MKILGSPFDWYHLTTLAPPKLRYHYCETTYFEELISIANIYLVEDIVKGDFAGQTNERTNGQRVQGS